MNQKIIFVAGIHGTERTPVDALTKMHTPFILGNPRAVQMKLRFIESDLNRAFGEKGNTYEHIRAREIISLIPSDACVVDFHTASSTTEPFVIIVDKKMISLASTLGIRKVVLFPDDKNLVSGSLIHKCSGCVVECGKHDDSDVVTVVESIVKNASKGVKKRVQLFQVVKKIDGEGAFLDFQKTSEGLYPILTGAKNHKGGYFCTLLENHSP